MIRVILYLLIYIFVCCCAEKSQPLPPNNTTPVDTISTGVRCNGSDTTIFRFSGTLAPLQIVEASGIIASEKNSGYFWIHDDGSRAILYLLDSMGIQVGSVKLLSPYGFTDIEDIALAKNSKTGIPFLYIADIGDNRAVRDIKNIGIFEEPTKAQVITTSQLILSPNEMIRFRYPDGKRDAESIMIDPINDDIYIVTKREAQVGVYKATTPLKSSTIDTLQKLGVLPYRLVTAADISRDGSEIIIRDYEKAYYWKRNANESIGKTLSKNAKCLYIFAEEQGEGICFSKDGSKFFTVSEKVSRPQEFIYTYLRR